MQEEQHAHRHPVHTVVHAWLEARVTRVVLAVLVIVSLLPLGAVDVWLRPVFLAVFGVELAARAWLWRSGRRVTTGPGVAFTIADVLAYLSFLPVEGWFSHDQLQLFAMLRLTRLFMLLRFSRELARDIYAIVTRREQLQTLGLVTGAVIVLSFVSAVTLSQLSISHDATNDMHPFRERLWWSFRQLESPDNLVPNLSVNPLLAMISLLLTITGVFMISFIIGVGSNVVEQVVRAERRRPLHYDGHTVIVGNVHGSVDLIREFVRIYAKNRQIPSPEKLLTWLRYTRPTGPRTFPRVALLSREVQPPDFLVEPIMRWVVYREGDEGEPESLARVAARTAKRAILLSRDDLAHETDAVTVSTLAALREQNRDAHVYVEVQDAATKDIVAEVGGPATVALDVPRFLGMFLCQHLITPGVESLYRDLLTADGAEIYTHLFVDAGERHAFDARTTALRFEDMQRLAARYDVVLIGVYLGTKVLGRNALGVVSVDDVVPWLNPIAPIDDPRLHALGATSPGLVPTSTLRGVIGVAESYLPLRAFAAALARGDAAPAPLRAAPTTQALLDAALVAPAPGPARVCLIGASESLPSLLRELSRYVPGVEVLLFVSARGDETTPLARRLEKLDVGIGALDPLPGPKGRTVALERGGRLRVFSHDAPDLASFAARHLRDETPVQAVVFLSEPEGRDRDARTSMRVLRFVRLLEDNAIPRGDRMHLLAEFISVDKGAYIQRHVDVRRCGFANTKDLTLTLIATQTIKSYFMVHASFVPGVSDVYERLLEEKGQDLLRFRVRPDAALPATTTLRALTDVCARRGVIPIALEFTGGRTVLAPRFDDEFTTEGFTGVYVLAEGEAIHGAVADVPPRAAASADDPRT